MSDSPTTSRDQVSTVIDQDLCIGCGLCVEVCPADTLSMEDGKATVSGRRSISCGHCAAICPVGAITITAIDPGSFSFASFELTPDWLTPGNYNVGELARLMLSRRSSRMYQDTEVSRDLLNDLVKIGTSAPSGTNSQCWTFTVLDKRHKVEKLGARIGDYFRKLNKLAANPLARFISRIFGRDTLGDYYRRYYETISNGLNEWEGGGRDRLFHGAPATIIIGATPGASCPMEDALLATQNILLAAHAMGLGTCLIGFAVAAMQRDPSIKDPLGIPRDEPVYAVISLGYPLEKYQRLTGRKKAVVRYPD